MLSKDVVPLPPNGERLAGESVDNKENYSLQVSNADGYLCRLQATCHFPVAPATVYAIFVNTDNTGVFRDIKTSGRREVIEEKPHGQGYRRVVEVEQVGESKILMWHTTFSTEVRVVEDDSDPARLKTEFELVRSDILTRFHGSWLVTPETDAKGQVIGCTAVLEQEVLPRGVPAFLAHVPVLGSALRGVVIRSAQRMIQDIESILGRVNGTTDIHEVLRRAARKGHAQEADKQAQAQRKEKQKQEAAEQKRSGHAGRFL
ncbi:TPA: hypothetical protein ACH3X2_002031 [Trebouxia sp. C0005]